MRSIPSTGPTPTRCPIAFRRRDHELARNRTLHPQPNEQRLVTIAKVDLERHAQAFRQSHGRLELAQTKRQLDVVQHAVVLELFHGDLDFGRDGFARLTPRLGDLFFLAARDARVGCAYERDLSGAG